LAKGACLRPGRLPVYGVVSRAGEVRVGASAASRGRANIAEGFGKRSSPEKARFLNIAEGSLEECRYYLILSQDLGYGQSESLMSVLEETSKLLNAYARAIMASGS
jgi:four helix bundle protein